MSSEFNAVHELYISSAFRTLRASLMSERVNEEDGILYCEHCHKPILTSYECVAHHIKEVTRYNLNDVSITLNPENILLVHHACHNEIHKRFGHRAERKVYCVHGAPCSGKTSFVNSHKGNSDLIVDVDNIWQCITGGERYFKPNALKQDMFAVRECLLDCVMRRVGNWETAWIITAEAFKTPREDLARRCGAELIHIDTDRQTCLERLYQDESRRDVREQWTKYIDEYFKQYSE